jgi:hypothetical protein
MQWLVISGEWLERVETAVERLRVAVRIGIWGGFCGLGWVAEFGVGGVPVAFQLQY